MDSIQKYVANVRILHLDAYNEGLFSHKRLKDADIWEEKEIGGSEVIRIPGIYGQKKMLNGMKDIRRGKELGGALVTERRVTPTPGIDQRLRSAHSHWLHSQKVELRQADSVHKRKMSTWCISTQTRSSQSSMALMHPIYSFDGTGILFLMSCSLEMNYL